MNFSKLTSIFILSFLAFSLTASAQDIPDPTGETQWDYCPCVEGIQALDDVCPCPQTPPPSGGGGGGGTNTGNTGTPTPTSIGGSTGTSWTEFLTMAMQLFCEKYPHLCDD